MEQTDQAIDVVLLEGGQLLLRASAWVESPGGDFGDMCATLRSSGLSIVAKSSPGASCGRAMTPLWLRWARSEPALDVRAIPGAPLLAVRWPPPQWRTILGGVELQEDFTVVDAQARPVLEITQPASQPRAEPDPDFNLADSSSRAWRHAEWFQRRSERRFALVRALDGAWIEYRALLSDGAWRVEHDR